MGLHPDKRQLKGKTEGKKEATANKAVTSKDNKRKEIRHSILPG